MLIWLGEEAAAKHLMHAVEAVTERGVMTKDLGGSASTQEVTDAVSSELGKTYAKGV
jgi:isocitrate/isopropylmalate dehydrogenase